MGNPIVHVEFSSRKPEDLRRFYEALFGWKFQHDPKLNYFSFETGAMPGGGLFQNEAMPPGIQVYVGVEDLDGTLKKAESLGATVMRWKEEIPGIGWWGLFRDPEGISMAVFKSSRPPAPPPRAKPAARKAKAKAKPKPRAKGKGRKRR